MKILLQGEKIVPAKKVAIVFQVDRRGRVTGEIVAGDPSAARKPCVVDRSYRGETPLPKEAWVCLLMRDTKPDQKGGFSIVLPIHRPTWQLVETRDKIGETVRMEPRCLEFPELAQEHVDEATWEACALRNAPYERARSDEEEFQNMPWAELYERFGTPTNVEPIGSAGHSFLVTFPGGRIRRGGAREVSLCFAPEAYTATGAWEWENSVSKVRVLAEYALHLYPLVRTWRWVATSGRVPNAEHQLPEATRTEIVQALREQLGTPEEDAERSSKLLNPPPFVAELVEELILLGSPGQIFATEDYSHGYKTCVNYRFTGRLEGKGPKGEGWAWLPKGRAIRLSNEARPPLSEEAVREEQRLVRARLEAELFHPPSITIPDEELRPGITEEEWTERASRHFNALAQAKREEVETTIRAGIAAAQTEYDEYHRLARDILRLRIEVSSVEEHCREVGFQTEWCHNTVLLGRSTLEALRQAHEAMTQWIETASNALAEELRQREEQKMAQAKALAEALSVPATPMPWFLDNVRAEDIESLTGRKEGEGIGDPVEGQRNLFLPGNRALVALRIGGDRKSRYHFNVEVSSLTPLHGSGSFPTHVPDHHGDNVFGLVTSDDWSVAVTEFDHEEVLSYTLYTATGIGRLVPAKEWQEESWHTASWNGEIGAGPSLEHVRRVFSLDASAPQISEETRIDREDLAIIFRAIGGTNVELVRMIRSFAQEVMMRLGAHKGAEMLRAELDATYGCGGKHRTVSEKVPSLTDTEGGRGFLRLRRGREVDAWLLGAATWLESRPEYAAKAADQPATITPVAATLADLAAKFGKGNKNKR